MSFPILIWLHTMRSIAIESVLILIVAQIIWGLVKGRINVVDWVTDKGSNKSSLHKTGQLAGWILVGSWFGKVLDKATFDSGADWTGFAFFFLAVGLLYIAPQAVVNWLNRNSPVPGQGRQIEDKPKEGS